MRIAEVAKLSPTDRLWYWIRERHNIYLRRKMGEPKPWTDDEVLQSFFFTNPYRENDKVTVWFRENIREPLRNDPRVLFATIAFRWFNLPCPTGQYLMRPLNLPYKGWEETASPYAKLCRSALGDNWNPKIVLQDLGYIRDSKGQIFTGAFMINSPPGKGKLEAIVERVTNVWHNREGLRMMWECNPKPSMEDVHKALLRYPGLGGFMAYEVVCDLRYTSLLENAQDKMNWCNPGPGAVRGMCRILGIPFDASNNSSSPPCPPNFLEECRKLLDLARTRLKGMPPMEMREIEHSLCEVDKYSRILLNEGRAKRRYNGV